MLEQIISNFNDAFWGNFLIYVLVGIGIYLTFRLRFVQIRMLKKAFGKIFSKEAFIKDSETGLSSFQALTTAIAAQIGTGNLAGAATAIVAGGPGAAFWMWLFAIFGMSTIFAEAVLAQKFRTKINGQIVGGPAYYIRDGLNSRSLAMIFAVLIILGYGMTEIMVQSNTISHAFKTAFNLPHPLVGIVLAFFAGLILIGGVKRIGSFAGKIVPLMSVLYIIGCLIVLVIFRNNILASFRMIFVGAFYPQAVAGGILGVTVRQAIRYGVARGLFSNEAGLGTTPHAHAVAKVKHPVDQGLVAMLGVIMDTFIVLTLTVLVILSTGMITSGETGIALTTGAFNRALGSIGGSFVAVCLLFFAFTSIIGCAFFAESNVEYLFKEKYGKRPINIYRMIVICCIIIGSLLKVDLIWQMIDLCNGFMLLPNVIALFVLTPIIIKEIKSFNELNK